MKKNDRAEETQSRHLSPTMQPSREPKRHRKPKPKSCALQFKVRSSRGRVAWALFHLMTTRSAEKRLSSFDPLSAEPPRAGSIGVESLQFPAQHCGGQPSPDSHSVRL